MDRILFVMLLAACAVAHAQQRDVDEVVVAGKADADMVAATRTALDGLDGFLAVAASPPEGTSGFKIKVGIAQGADTEHFWVSPFQRDGDAFVGVLANAPKLITGVAAGQTIRFTRDQVSDWGYVKDGRQVGSFTVCALFKRMPPEQVAYYRKNHGFDCPAEGMSK